MNSLKIVNKYIYWEKRLIFYPKKSRKRTWYDIVIGVTVLKTTRGKREKYHTQKIGEIAPIVKLRTKWHFHCIQICVRSRDYSLCLNVVNFDNTLEISGLTSICFVMIMKRLDRCKCSIGDASIELLSKALSTVGTPFCWSAVESIGIAAVIATQIVNMMRIFIFVESTMGSRIYKNDNSSEIDFC